MRTLFIFSFIILSMNTSGQTTTNEGHLSIPKVNNRLENDSLLKNKSLSEILLGQVNQPSSSNNIDTSLKVIYLEKEINKPAYFINDKFLYEGLLVTLIKVGDVDDITVLKDSIKIDNITYYGQIRIKTKKSFNPKIISLQALKEKYTNLKNKSSIFMVDGVIVNAESDKYFVDENNLLRIIIDRVENTKENIDLGLIKILTKSETNINDLKKIRIR